jgi:sulfatase maturation enzyme AslB (radical SAM superfamily)
MTIRSNLESLKNKIKIEINRYLGRTFIPHRRTHLYVEPSSICNLRCAFCAYDEKTTPRINMPNPFFFDVIEQATEMGYERFGLTPITGELFMDKNVMDKIEYLENHPKVKSFHFFTNFTMLDEDKIKRFSELSKLAYMGISIYGHNKNSFVATTKSPPHVYQRLVNNMQILYSMRDNFKGRLKIRLRARYYLSRSQKDCDNSLADIIKKLREDKAIPFYFTKRFNNWGGLIAQSNVDELGIKIRQAKDVYKKGPCALIFYKQQIMADGRVNACACRDANATLCIGDLKKAPLKEVLSTRNKCYMQLIEDQQRDKFNAICQSCDFYKSIYKPSRRYNMMTLEEFFHGW